MMSTCRWCTSASPDASDLLQKYCFGSLSAEDEQAANDDLCYCLECVVEYHRARDKLPSLHKRLWELETSRLLACFTRASETELEDNDLLIVQDDQEIQVPAFTAAEYENILRVPLTEILKYPYLVGHSTLCEMCVEAICKMENSNSFQVFDKYQGIYLLLVHPNETVRRWAIHTARSLGKVDRDDFYDLQDIFSSMFSVIELDIFQDSDIDTCYDPKTGKMVLLPRHLYDSTNYKNYWLGICMLLTVLDAQAMDSLMLGPDKQTDFMQCILNTMEKAVEDESMDPFWPSLQCFMVILDRLGSKVWGHQIEPTSAFQAITGSASYATEIENVRRTTMSKVKVERPCDDDDMVTCSQIIYESNIKEKRKLAKDWEKNTGRISHNLKLVGLEYTNQIANATFTACLNDQDVQHQLYPKEDDLVILWFPQNRSMYTCHEPELLEPSACFGCVSRSSVYFAEERPTLNLTIQTRGNVSSVDNQAVKCQLMGSLVSAIRAFRALYMLKNNTMFRPVLAPQVSFFEPCQENIFVKSLPEYNPEQVKAIKWGVSIVKRQQRSPKICLIHGPPGTGKSKTIAGLLQSLFSEPNVAAMAGRNSKACRLRVLLCAPSNAAIDNLMKKVIVVFKENCRNIQNPLGNCGDINLVRLGMEKSISINLKPFSLDSQTRARTQKAQQGHDTDIDRRKQQLDQRIDNLSKMCAMVEKNTDKFRRLTDEKSKLLKEREQLGRQLRETRSRKQETQAKVLQDAHVICCTLSTSGSMVLESAFRRLGHEPFSCVIVDEARQATEPETLIPMLFRCPALILVGDPDQLPPTVVSQTAKEKRYDQSLMARLLKCLHRTAKENPHIHFPVVFLNKQYRMHPDINRFPSDYIYKKALKTDKDTEQNRCALTWPFQPYLLFDVLDGRETKDNDSFCNYKEVKLVLTLIKMILDKQLIKVGVITPYNAQKYRIQEYINREMAKEDGKRLQVEVDTVDGFQGREMDCVIVSCVRASDEAGSIGFLGNRQRMNVMITRAKYSLFILGHLRTLQEHRDWGALVKDAVKRKTIIPTCEKDFKKKARFIFKPELGLMRSLSHPPREPGFPPAARPSAEAPVFLSSERPCSGPGSARAGERAAPSGPPAAERPRDPRLAVHLPRPRQGGGDQERPHCSRSAPSRSVSREEGEPAHRGSRQAQPYPPHAPRGPHKRPSDGYSSSASSKAARR
ncbi:probable helicase senataxin isoform X4 [Conger conger]|uniref:probable helicase senataxin isoform X4 n=1 Tax=Conger conger TaxID=82655 RepID=UPI002A59DEF3|nr:probable helicase senataxin isoform X4 [Conger conger]